MPLIRGGSMPAIEMTRQDLRVSQLRAAARTAGAKQARRILAIATCGAAAPAIGAETSRVNLPAPSALHGIKIDTNESALDLNRTEALLAT